MNINCTHCKSALSVDDSAFANGIPDVMCPICGKTFKPILNKQPGAQGANQAPSGSGPSNTPPAGQGATVAWLLASDANTPKQSLPIRQGRHLVGRKSVSMQCDIMIETADMNMSRNHFYISAAPNRNGVFEFILTDNNSTRGTLLNKSAIKPGNGYILTNGDVITAGTVDIKFLVEETRPQSPAGNAPAPQQYMETVVVRKN